MMRWLLLCLVVLRPVSAAAQDITPSEIRALFERDAALWSPLPDLLRAAFIAAEDRDHLTKAPTRSTLTRQLAATIAPRQAPRQVQLQYHMAIAAALRPEEIAAWYSHRVYIGRNCWGISQAAHLFFGTPAEDLAPQEAALLARLVKAPTRYDPDNDPIRATERRTFMLSQMASAGVLTGAEAARLATLPPGHLSPLGTCEP